MSATTLSASFGVMKANVPLSPKIQASVLLGVCPSTDESNRRY